MTEYCLGCTTELDNRDADPNGDMGCICARCRAEEEHDYDIEPNVRFNRDGTCVEIEGPMTMRKRLRAVMDEHYGDCRSDDHKDEAVNVILDMGFEIYHALSEEYGFDNT